MSNLLISIITKKSKMLYKINKFSDLEKNIKYKIHLEVQVESICRIKN